MARLTLKPLVITAYLRHGLSLDLRYGIALDGLLTASLRASEGYLKGIMAGSLLDGGLALGAPKEWDLPLGKCKEDLEIGWHWMATTGQPIDIYGKPLPSAPFDPHRLMVRLDERRSEAIALSIPKNVGGPRGRYRTRVTPVMNTPCFGLVWHAYGNSEKIKELVESLTTIGARRGSGEGAVSSWDILEVSPKGLDIFTFAHTHPDGNLGRPVPTLCAQKLGFKDNPTGYAGIRPPMFHSSRQKILVLPKV